jgi:hypothetical protein
MRSTLFTGLVFFLFTASLAAQDQRAFTAEEKATHTKNITTIMGKWKTTLTAINILDDALKPKQAELEKVYGDLFAQSAWEFINTGSFLLTTNTNNKTAPEKGTFTVTAQFLTLYLDGKTIRCLMKIEDDGKLIIHVPIAGKSIYALQLEKQPA